MQNPFSEEKFNSNTSVQKCVPSYSETTWTDVLEDAFSASLQKTKKDKTLGSPNATHGGNILLKENPAYS